MSDPEDQPKSTKGRFQPGNRFAKGRQPGAIGKKTFREKLLSGLARSGEKRARKDGVNGKIDGIERFVEHLADTNSSAAASLVSKLIPPEEQKTNANGHTTAIIINSVLAGNQFAPGKCGVLLPFDLCTEAWAAYHAGDEAWSACLKKLEPMLTKAAFEALSLVVPPIASADDADRRDNVTPLRLIKSPASQEIEPSMKELNNMTIDKLFEQMRERGLGGMTLNELREREPTGDEEA